MEDSSSQLVQYINMLKNMSIQKAADAKKRRNEILKENKAKTLKVKKQTASPSKGTYFQNAADGYTNLLKIFQYLRVQDLLRVGRVCRMWRDVSRHPVLWTTVRMKNSEIRNANGLANAVQQHRTVHLDLRKMIHSKTVNRDVFWQLFTEEIKKFDRLQSIKLSGCLASVIEALTTFNHRLELINAIVKCNLITFDSFKNLLNLKELRIRSIAGMALTSDLSALKSLTQLKILSLTSIVNLNNLNVEVIGRLVNLEVLEIGECSDFYSSFGPDVLGKLVKLEKLRLEGGDGDCQTFDILAAVKDLDHLYQLELVNFDIKSGFDNALGECRNIKKLLIIPTYASKSFITNNIVMSSVLRLRQTLTHFVWGITSELIHVTKLFVEHDIRGNDTTTTTIINDSIPVLEPVPLYGLQLPPNQEAPEIEILPLAILEKLLPLNLPTTQVKIIKIPFQATWRQSIQEE